MLELWFWKTWQMLPDQIERLTPRQTDNFIERGLAKR